MSVSVTMKSRASKSGLPAAATFVGAAVVIGGCIAKRLTCIEEQKGATRRKKPNMSVDTEHNIQRKAALANGGAKDHVGAVVVVPDESFDLDATIFKALSGSVPRLNQRAKLGVKQYWDEEVALAVQESYAHLPAVPRHDAAILNFMYDECDFSCEHADGSFMDHLNFCHDYSSLHFKGHSPRVLFLHSIMGVGTNVFPMPHDKLPQLESLLTPFEFSHVEAFPSVLRLLAEGSLLDRLTSDFDSLGKLHQLSFHRVLDNALVTLDAENVWIQLNYQLMHLLDFLPVACWGVNWDEPMMQIFLNLYQFLHKAGKLEAHVVEPSFSISDADVTGQPQRWIDCIIRLMPSSVKRSLAARAIRTFSEEIGHSLDFSLEFH
jgi:hypothetical protein